MAFHRRIQPGSVGEVRPHLYTVPEIHPDLSWRGAYIIHNNDWPVPPNPVYGSSVTSWFRLDRGMRGAQASLADHAGGSITIGDLGDQGSFGAIALNVDHSPETVNFKFMTEGVDNLEVAAEGVFQYLRGYDPSESARISTAASGIITAHRQELDAALDSVIKGLNG